MQVKENEYYHSIITSLQNRDNGKGEWNYGSLSVSRRLQLFAFIYLYLHLIYTMHVKYIVGALNMLYINIYIVQSYKLHLLSEYSIIVIIHDYR